MVIKKRTIFSHLLGILLLLSIIAAYPQFMALLKGNYMGLTLEGQFGFRIFREIILLIIYMIFFKNLILNLFRKKFFGFIFLVLIVVSISFIYTILKLQNLIIIIPFIGLRMFEYLPLILVVFKMLDEKSVNVFNKYVFIFIFIEALIGIVEVFYAPPILGKTIFGSRAFGTFSSPNLFGFTMATLALYLYFVNKRSLYFYLSLIMAVLSGSRNAMLLSFLIIVFNVANNIEPYFRTIILFFLPFLLGLIYKIASMKYFSGRLIMHEGRIFVWSQILSKGIHSIWDILFGWGLGLGANTLTTFFGPGKFPGQFISDSAFIYILSAFGIIGLFLYLSILFLAFFSFKYNAVLLSSFLMLSSVPVVWFENFPSNFIICIVCGIYLQKVSEYNILKNYRDVT